MAASSRVIPSYEYRRTRWRNGGGWTREIHAEPGADGDWDWRLSIAEITDDGPFSTFAGVDRELVLLAGEGVRLRFEDGEVAEVLPPYGRHRFAGERPVHGELVTGPTHDFNLMWRRERFAADLWRRPMVGAMVVFAEPHSTWIVHVLAGGARFADGTGLPDLATGDTAILQAGDERLRHVLDGGGEALLIRLLPQDAARCGDLPLDGLG
ncbi:MAG TPA: HutD family protein [Lysobacter sp.]|nr:HutD family protein [Lysobacter sp.]